MLVFARLHLCLFVQMADRYQRRVRKWLDVVTHTTGLNASQLARKAGLSTTTLTRFMNSDEHHYTLSGKTISKIADATGIPFDVQADATRLIRVAPPEEFTAVPIYDIRASAGAGSLVEDGEPTGWQPYREQELARLTRSASDELAVIQVAGDSMWETLHDGDKVLIDRTIARIVKDGIYVISFEEELLVKRCQRNLNDGSVLVSSDNKAYSPFNVTEADRLNVIGRVIWIGRALG